MTTAGIISRGEPRRLLHSAAAVLLGLVAVAVQCHW